MVFVSCEKPPASTSTTTRLGRATGSVPGNLQRTIAKLIIIKKGRKEPLERHLKNGQKNVRSENPQTKVERQPAYPDGSFFTIPPLKHTHTDGNPTTTTQGLKERERTGLARPNALICPARLRTVGPPFPVCSIKDCSATATCPRVFSSYKLCGGLSF